MRDSPDMAGDTRAASLVRHTVDLPYKVGSIMGIADAMCDSPDMTGDIYSQRHLHDAQLTCLIRQVA
jgi:hypothetical protein